MGHFSIGMFFITRGYISYGSIPVNTSYFRCVLDNQGYRVARPIPMYKRIFVLILQKALYSAFIVVNAKQLWQLWPWFGGTVSLIPYECYL
jgi:hypothetical protein